VRLVKHKNNLHPRPHQSVDLAGNDERAIGLSVFAEKLTYVKINKNSRIRSRQLAADQQGCSAGSQL